MDSVDGDSALSKAAGLGNIEMVKLLLKYGSSCMVNHRSCPISYACHGHLEVVQHLIENGADVNRVPDRLQKRTPLIAAVQHGSVEIVKCLLQAKANVDQVGFWNITPILSTVLIPDRGHITKLLLDAKCNVHIPNIHGTTPLHAAVCAGHVDVIRLLLAAGANVDQADENGRTPLHNAAHHDNIEVLGLLIAAGADVRTPYGLDDFTPMKIAEDSGLEADKVVQFLKPFNNAPSIGDSRTCL